MRWAKIWLLTTETDSESDMGNGTSHGQILKRILEVMPDAGCNRNSDTKKDAQVFSQNNIKLPLPETEEAMGKRAVQLLIC